MDLEIFIRNFNLVTTGTVMDAIELVYILNNNVDREVNYSNSINLYHLVESFNKYYLLFKNDYSNLIKFNLGKKEEIIKFYACADGESSFRNLIIYIYNIDKEICNHYETLLYLCEKNGKTYSYITNGLNFFDKDFYRKELQLDSKIIKSYLDFGEKYGLFIDSYDDLRNKFIFGNGCTVLLSKINGNLYEEINDFELSLGNVYFNSYDYINIIFRLGDGLSIDYDMSKVVFDNVECDDKKEIINRLIHKLYINKNKLSNMYSSEKVKKLINE